MTQNDSYDPLAEAREWSAEGVAYAAKGVRLEHIRKAEMVRNTRWTETRNPFGQGRWTSEQHKQEARMVKEQRYKKHVYQTVDREEIHGVPLLFFLFILISQCSVIESVPDELALQQDSGLSTVRSISIPDRSRSRSLGIRTGVHRLVCPNWCPDLSNIPSDPHIRIYLWVRISLLADWQSREIWIGQPRM